MKLRLPAQDPKWVTALYYLLGTLSAFGVALLRNKPWDMASVAALLLAWACSVGVFRGLALLAFKQPAVSMLLTFATCALAAGTAAVILP